MDRLPEQIGEILAEATRPETCELHGPYLKKPLLQGRLWTRCPVCQEEHDRKQAEDHAKKLAIAAERQHAYNLDASRVPQRFIGRSFDNFTATTDAMRQALTIARDFAESFDGNLRTGRGLILSGMPGTGKSHLAAAILQEHMHRPVCYLTCMDLIRSVRETWRRDSEKTESQVLAYLGSLDLLAIDEIGVQYGTDGEQTILFDVLDRRYRDVRPTILLTNQDKDGFKKFIGERAYDRLTETCRWVPFDWPSYRPTARREAK